MGLEMSSYILIRIRYMMEQAAPQQRGKQTGTIAMPPLLSELEELSLAPEAASRRHLALPLLPPSVRVIVWWMAREYKIRPRTQLLPTIGAIYLVRYDWISFKKQFILTTFNLRACFR